MAITTFTAAQVLTAAQMNAVQGNDYNQTVSTKTASYTLVAADKGTRVVMNVAGANTVTVNTSLFSAGDTVVLQNIGAGVATVTAGTATVSSAGPLAIPQYGSGTLYFTSAGVAIYFPSAVTASAGALTFIARTTFTAAVSLAMTNVFSATYDNYLVQVTNLVASADAGEARVQLGTSGSADTGSNYDFAYISTDNATATASQTLDTSHWKMLASYVGTSGYPSQMNIFLSSPNLARGTNCTATNFGNRNLYLQSATFGGAIITNTQYTDFFLVTAGTPTHSCTITVYGLANS